MADASPALPRVHGRRVRAVPRAAARRAPRARVDAARRSRTSCRRGRGGRAAARAPRRSTAPRRTSQRAAAPLFRLAARDRQRRSSPTARWPTCCGGWPCFGLTLVRLDIRQERQRHTEAIDADRPARGQLGGYADWPEDAARRVPRVGARRGTAPARARQDLRRTTRAPPKCCRRSGRSPRSPPESLGAYVITMAGRPSDVLAVELLQRRAGVDPPLRVVPLFETARDLRAVGRGDRPAAVDPVVSRARGARPATGRK